MVNLDIFKGVETIGLVCIDSRRLSPVAAVLLRDMLLKSKKETVRSIQVYHGGYERKGHDISNRALSYLQRKGFTQSDQLRVERIDKIWARSKDLILTMDKFIKRDVIYDFPMTDKDLKKSVFTLTEAAGVNERIRDPGEDYSYEIDPVFDLIERCLKEIVKKLERVN